MFRRLIRGNREDALNGGSSMSERSSVSAQHGSITPRDRSSVYTAPSGSDSRLSPLKHEMVQNPSQNPRGSSKILGLEDRRATHPQFGQEYGPSQTNEFPVFSPSHESLEKRTWFHRAFRRLGDQGRSFREQFFKHEDFSSRIARSSVEEEPGIHQKWHSRLHRGRLVKMVNDFASKFSRTRRNHPDEIDAATPPPPEGTWTQDRAMKDLIGIGAGVSSEDDGSGRSDVLEV